MLILTKPGADFSRGCAGKRIGHLLFATLPHLGIREWLQASILSGDSRRSESLCSLPQNLVARNNPKAGIGYFPTLYRK
jgi:hypothetical protein